MRTVWWEPDAVCLIDQTRLPREQETVRCTTVAEVAASIRGMVVRGAPAIGVTAAYGMALAALNSHATERAGLLEELAVAKTTVAEVVAAIRGMVVRGAPAIGVTAAYGMALAALNSHATERAGLLEELAVAKTTLDAARPTAVNLSWATERIRRMALESRPDEPVREVAAKLLDEAHAIHDEDERVCRAIGDHGAALLDHGSRVLTHCNAGGLATTGYGTALAPIRTAHTQGKKPHVLVDETRPFLQGSRLTAWELQQAGVQQTLITDSMAGHFMQRGEVDCIIVGADRVVANGDIANKIGTYSLAVLARAHGIPFYVAAPTSTIDMSLESGGDIVIEQRDGDEVTQLAGQSLAPAGVHAAHPAFDVTPHNFITAIITERGIVEPPFDKELRRVMQEA